MALKLTYPGVKVGQRPAQRNLDARLREIRFSLAEDGRVPDSAMENMRGVHCTVTGAANKLAASRAKRPECGIGSGAVAAQPSGRKS